MVSWFPLLRTERARMGHSQLGDAYKKQRPLKEWAIRRGQVEVLRMNPSSKWLTSNANELGGRDATSQTREVAHPYLFRSMLKD
jgi:hypothetical protein